MSTPAAVLRERLSRPGALTCPGCFDALSARLIARAGFELSMMGGFSVAAARLAVPDLGLVTFSEMLDGFRAIRTAAPEVSLIADGDTGYGGSANIARTLRDYTAAGAAAVMIEDQSFPKRCGHFEDKTVVERDEARRRIRAAAMVRDDLGLDILILARTDANAPLGFDEAMRRIEIFAEEGADILFLEAPRSESEMARFAGAFDHPTMANLVPGGQTPVLPRKELAEMGFKILNYPVLLLDAAIGGMQASLEELERRDGQVGEVVPFATIKSLLGIDEITAFEKRVAS